ncbi:hypothetical protein WISP_123166 [Willisornis vidua]|uniref:Uncharacterized protein n=1 Tax=Willisornis vidua TaxID=1566151 RepID=A0ABQ9CRV7_9PASS|nr:hypothetical protein WISP_123166 [Willisornis vidua]
MRLTVSGIVLQGGKAAALFGQGQTDGPGDNILFWQTGSLEGNKRDSLPGLARLHPDRTKHPSLEEEGRKQDQQSAAIQAVTLRSLGNLVASVATGKKQNSTV